MAQEIELKLQIAKKDIQTFLGLDCLKKGSQTSYILKNTYYDTQDALLASHKIALRVRQQDKRFIQTLKTQGENQGGLHVRAEFEFDVKSDQLDLSLINKELLQYLPINSVDELDLKGLFCTDFHRTQIMLKNIEVVFDQGHVTYQELSDEICEIELELKNQSISNQSGIAQIFELAIEISGQISVMPSDVSKARRGERLKCLSHAEKYRIKKPTIDTNNLQQNIVNCMEYIQTNWESYCFSRQISYLADAILFIDKLHELLLNSNEMKKYSSKITQIKQSWSLLLDRKELDDNTLADKTDELFDKLQQDKTIGQTWLSLSQVCHQGASQQGASYE